MTEINWKHKYCGSPKEKWNNFVSEICWWIDMEDLFNNQSKTVSGVQAFLCILVMTGGLTTFILSIINTYDVFFPILIALFFVNVLISYIINYSPY